MTSSPSPTPEQFKEQQRQQWATTAKTWRQWSAELAAQTRAATELILQEAQVRPGMQVLDLASGTGEPALSLAAAVAPDGQVTATDLVPVMLAVTQEHALTRGLTNLTTQQADIEALPFSDASFDAITCRFGIMFCPDMPRAMAEIRRVLKPGGRAAFVVWGTPEQPYFTTTEGIVAKYAPFPQPPSGAPTRSRFAAPGSLAAALQAAGFREVRETPHTIPWAFPGPPERSWEFVRAGAAFQRAFATIPADQHAQVTAEVLAALQPYYDGRQVDTPAKVISAVAVR
jgi:SAM-dependent methyltransferase